MIFRGRKALRARDRALGLVFSWRLPLSSRGMLFFSLCVVSLVAVICAMGVRVTAGAGTAESADQASVVILSKGYQGDWIERWAMEVGPFPARWNLASDPDYVAKRTEALRMASETGPPPPLRLTQLEWGERQVVWGKESIMHLPSLPAPEEYMPKANDERVVPVVLNLLSAGEGLELIGSEMMHDAMGEDLEIGVRFLMKHDAQGRIQEVIRLDLDASAADFIDWMMRYRIRGHGEKPGWVVVETAVKS